jgi:hypothetical protein
MTLVGSTLVVSKIGFLLSKLTDFIIVLTNNQTYQPVVYWFKVRKSRFIIVLSDDKKIIELTNSQSCY